MSKKRKSTSIDLVEISEREFFIKEPSEKVKKGFNKNLLHLGIGVNFSPTEHKDQLSPRVFIKYEYPHDDSKLELLRAVYLFQFEISDMDNIITAEKEKIEIPEGLAINLVSVSLSTVRGLIASKTKGYYINKFYLPIITQNDLIGILDKNNEKGGGT